MSSSDNPHELNGVRRVPSRISITIPQSTYEALVLRSGQEGRSLSNLAAFVLEAALSAVGR